MGTLSVVRRRDWRFAAWSAGLMAVILGVVSIAYPALESSLGTIGGALVVGWAIVFVVSVEYTRRGDAADDADSVAETETGTA